MERRVRANARWMMQPFVGLAREPPIHYPYGETARDNGSEYLTPEGEYLW